MNLIFNTLTHLFENKLFIALSSALFALFFKHLYDLYFKKKDIKKKKQALIDLLENVIVRNLMHLENNYKELTIVYSNQSFRRVGNPKILYVSSLDNNILKFFSPSDLISIMNSVKSCQLSELYELIYDVNSLNSIFSNEIVEKNYFNRLNEIVNDNQNKYPGYLKSVNMRDLKLEFLNVLKEKKSVTEILINDFNLFINKLKKNHS